MRKLFALLTILAFAGLAEAQWNVNDTVSPAGDDPNKTQGVQGVTGGTALPISGSVTLSDPVTAVTTGGDEIANETTLAAMSAAQATAALQTAANALLTTISLLDFATETTQTAQATAALQTAANALLTTISTLDFATETTLTAQSAAQATAALQTAANALLTTISTLDFATQTTLAAQFAAQATAANQTTGNTNTGTTATNTTGLNNTVAGSEQQVDIVTMPSVTLVDLSTNTITARLPLEDDQDKVSMNTEDFDTSGGFDWLTIVGIGLPSGTGAVVGGTATNPFRMDPTGTTTQPISAASLPLATGAATAANQTTSNTNTGTTATNTTGLNNTVSGSEQQVDIVASLPAGDNNIGNFDIVTMPNVTLADASTNSIGARAILDGTEWSEVKNYTTAQTDNVVKACPAGKRLIITGIFISCNDSVNIEFENETDVAVVNTIYMVGAGSGAVVPYAKDAPLALMATDQDLEVDTTAAVNHGFTVTGYIIN